MIGYGPGKTTAEDLAGVGIPIYVLTAYCGPHGGAEVVLAGALDLEGPQPDHASLPDGGEIVDARFLGLSVGQRLPGLADALEPEVRVGCPVEHRFQVEPDTPADSLVHIQVVGAGILEQPRLPVQAARRQSDGSAGLAGVDRRLVGHGGGTLGHLGVAGLDLGEGSLGVSLTV
ncbi:MAG: hypothetical protein ACRDV2_02725, partial [Actinomycetes bacterium]